MQRKHYIAHFSLDSLGLLFLIQDTTLLGYRGFYSTKVSSYQRNNWPILAVH
jgi:hypothetical protein